MTTHHDEAVVLDRDEAAELVHLLTRVEDWLRHASDDTREELAGFLDGVGHGRLATAGLVDLLGCHAAALYHRVKQVNR